MFNLNPPVIDAPLAAPPMQPPAAPMAVPDLGELQVPALPEAMPMQPPSMVADPGGLAREMGLPMEQLVDYQAKFQTGEKDAAILARMDILWEQVARKHKLLTGDRNADQLVWEEHQAYVSGMAEQDPLHDCPAAIEEFEDIVLAEVGKIARIGGRYA